jgi:hypothetical protein
METARVEMALALVAAARYTFEIGVRLLSARARETQGLYGFFRP